MKFHNHVLRLFFILLLISIFSGAPSYIWGGFPIDDNIIGFIMYGKPDTTGEYWSDLSDSLKMNALQTNKHADTTMLRVLRDSADAKGMLTAGFGFFAGRTNRGDDSCFRHFADFRKCYIRLTF